MIQLNPLVSVLIFYITLLELFTVKCLPNYTEMYSAGQNDAFSIFLLALLSIF